MIKRELIRKLVACLLRPVLRFCTRHALYIQDIDPILKEAWIKVASDELVRRGEKITVSRLSVMTGIHRRDVLKYSSPEKEQSQVKDFISKIMGQWQNNRSFVTKAGAARVLSIGGDKSEFTALVKSVSGDLNSATVLFELERAEVIERVGSSARLVVDSYTPKGNSEAMFGILEKDLTDIVIAAEENSLASPEIPNLHCRTDYDRIRPAAIPEIKRWLLKEGHAFHARAREFISQFDQDVNPEATFSGKGQKVVVGSYGKVDERE